MPPRDYAVFGPAAAGAAITGMDQIELADAVIATKRRA